MKRSITNSIPQYPTPKEVYVSFLSKMLTLPPEGYPITEEDLVSVIFEDRNDPNRWIQVDRQTEDTDVNFPYPYDENPTKLFSDRGISFPESYALNDWWGQPVSEAMIKYCKETGAEIPKRPDEEMKFTDFRGPALRTKEEVLNLADTIDDLFLKLLGASANYTVEVVIP